MGFIQQYFNSLFNTYTWIYFILAILIIAFRFLLVKYKEEGKNLLYTANTLIAWFYLINLFNFLIEMLIAWYGQNTYELYYFSELKYFNDRAIFFTKLFASLLIGLLFFIQKIRKSTLFTALFIILLYFERMVIFITSLYRDFLPPSSENKLDFSYSQRIIEILIIALLLILIYTIVNKKGKLPHPSLFLK